MELKFKPKAIKDLDYWKKKNKRTLTKIQSLFVSVLETPYEGIGKPEALKYDLAGYWSRRITKEHRFVYTVDEANGIIHVYSLKGHYE